MGRDESCRGRYDERTPLHAYRVIEDLQVRFAEWDHADARVRRWTDADIPLQFDDADQGWALVIREHKLLGLVLILEGDDVVPEYYKTGFCVPRERYIAAWREAIDWARKEGKAFLSVAEASAHPAPKRLFLWNMGLTELPPEIGRLTSLEFIDAGLNRLATVPEEIGALKRLRALSLRFNKITRLPDSIRGLTALEDLDLGECPIQELPDGFFELPALKTLNVKYGWRPKRAARGP